METLASRIAREGGLPDIDAVGWAIRVAFSVEQIHALGGVHGRLSADGILIESAKCTSEGRLIPFAELPENVAYHSPERELGEGGSQADDTWAVAVTLYLALSGSLPFSGAGDDEVRRKIRSVPAPPLAVFDIGDDALQAIVDRALARHREARTASVGDLRRELEAWRPEARLDALPPLLTDDEPDEEVTMIHSGASSVRAMIEAAAAAPAPRKPSVSPPRPASATKQAAPEVPDVLAAAVVGTPSSRDGGDPHTPGPAGAPGPADDDPEEATLMLREGLRVNLPGLVDDASIPDRTEDPFAVPASRAAVPHVAASASPSSAPPSGPPSSGARSAHPASTPPPASPRASSPPGGSLGGSVTQPAEASAAAPPRRSLASLVLLCVVVFVVAAIASVLWSRSQAPEAPPPADSATPSTSADHPASPATTSPEALPASAPAPASAAPSVAAPAGAPAPASAPASASVAPASAPAAGVAACVVPLFPPDSFDASTDFSFVCAEADPLKGGAAIRTQIVRTHHNISEGMKEWALLGWYELAAFSVIRARCCPSAPPLQISEVRGCTPVPELLAGISAAAAATTDPGDKALKKAVDAYTNDIYCIVRSGIAARFGRVGNPQGGEDTTFMRFLGRVVAARR